MLSKIKIVRWISTYLLIGNRVFSYQIHMKILNTLWRSPYLYRGVEVVSSLYLDSWWVYPVVITTCCLFFIYAKLFVMYIRWMSRLCFTSLFYYILYMILSPVCMITVFISFLFRSLLTQNRWKSWIVGIHNILVMFIIICSLLRHKTHSFMFSTISQYPVFFVMYTWMNIPDF